MKKRFKILIVDDDANLRMLLRDRLEANAYLVIEAEDGASGIEVAQTENPDLVLLDIQMPNMDGIKVLGQLRKKNPDMLVVMMTAFGSIERAVEALKLGAIDFLPKPCKPDHILFVLEKALAQKELKEQNVYLRSEIRNQYRMIVGNSLEMTKVAEIADQVARSKTTVLIEGESGTGKQLMARYIHDQSDRKEHPFVQVNCTTLAENLIESDLFGHEKGAFTGALREKKGRFELADGGTVFLDEIGDLPAGLQSKLLHVLEYGQFERVGSEKTTQVDVRIVAATNKDLRKQVSEGLFREDLYYRLNVVNLILPPLRSRIEDIELYANHFIQKHGLAMQKEVEKMPENMLRILQKYSWPGNIRELENVIQRVVVLAPGKTLTSDLLPSFSSLSLSKEIDVNQRFDEAVTAFKKKFITKALEHHQFHQAKTAKMLGMQRSYLSRLIKQFDIRRQ